MKRVYFLSIAFSLCLAAPGLMASAYAQSDESIADDALDAPSDTLETDADDGAADAIEETALEETTPLQDDTTAPAPQDDSVLVTENEGLDRNEDSNAPPDLSDLAVRESETAKICDAACTGAPGYESCVSSCVAQTYACFGDCDELPTNKNDCFIGCTHIAMDERERQEELAQRILEKEQEPVYGRKMGFGMNLVGGLHVVPNFLVGAFFERSVPHWNDGAKFFYGGEFVFRFNDRHDLLLSIDYADYQTRDGWWLENDKNATAAEWVHNDLRALAVTIGWNGIVNLDKQKRAHFYGGLGLGLTVKVGDFNKAKVRLGCVNPGTDLSVYDDLSIYGPCPDDSGTVLRDQDPSGEITAWEKEKIPSVLPSFVVTAGFRYIIADYVSIAIEGGYKTVAFYGALKVGFMLGKTNAERQAELHRAAIHDGH